MAAAVQLRMDRSKAFATVNGERAPNDPHAKVYFFQDGLPFDAHGNYVDGLVTEPKLLALAERKLKKLAKASAPKDPAAIAGEPDGLPGDQGDDDDGDESDEDRGPSPSDPQDGDLNLQLWLMGQAQYQWFSVAAAISKRYGKRITSVTDAVLFLVGEEKLVSGDQLAPHFKKHLG
jgi:hypothetical protein